MVSDTEARSRSTTIVTVLFVALLAATLWELWWQDATHLPAIRTPVIALDEPWESTPSALVSGELTREGDCLLLDGEVVFWQAGAGWDRDREAVVYDGLDPMPVGGMVTGSGGHYEATTDFADLLGGPGRRIESCLASTGAPGAVFVAPGR